MSTLAVRAKVRALFPGSSSPCCSVLTVLESKSSHDHLQQARDHQARLQIVTFVHVDFSESCGVLESYGMSEACGRSESCGISESCGTLRHSGDLQWVPPPLGLHHPRGLQTLFSFVSHLCFCQTLGRHTTAVTRTCCFSPPPRRLQNLFFCKKTRIREREREL